MTKRSKRVFHSVSYYWKREITTVRILVCFFFFSQVTCSFCFSGQRFAETTRRIEKSWKNAKRASVPTTAFGDGFVLKSSTIVRFRLRRYCSTVTTSLLLRRSRFLFICPQRIHCSHTEIATNVFAFRLTWLTRRL